MHTAAPRPYTRLLHEESKDIAGMLSQLPPEVNVEDAFKVHALGLQPRAESQSMSLGNSSMMPNGYTGMLMPGYGEIGAPGYGDMAPGYAGMHQGMQAWRRAAWRWGHQVPGRSRNGLYTAPGVGHPGNDVRCKSAFRCLIVPISTHLCSAFAPALCAPSSDPLHCYT